MVLDDGTEIAIPAPVFSSSGLRELRFGQRVRFTTEGEGDDRRMTSIHIATLYY